MFDDMETNMGVDEQEKLHRLFEEAETPLYKGSRFMKLDVVLKVLNLKLKHGGAIKVSQNEAKLLCWHSEERVIDEKLRHVADSPQWRNIDNKYPEFGNEMRNIRLGISSDGINPFGNMSSRHSTWPVLLCIYNLPPWLCMSLLIQGPTQPGNDIDVYMSPLIDDLKTLWSSGVDVYDAYKKE
ncbi:hypothetical protein LXL04_003549 [Taraxacum kok-saghyz]